MIVASVDFNLSEGMKGLALFSVDSSDEIKKVFKCVCKQIGCLIYSCFFYPELDGKTIDFFTDNKNFQHLEIPDENHIQIFMLYIMRQFQLEDGCCVISYIFLERLVKNAKVALLPYNWKQFILISLLATKCIYESKISLSSKNAPISDDSEILRIFPFVNVIGQDIVEVRMKFFSVCNLRISPKQFINCYSYLCTCEEIISISPPKKLLEILEFLEKNTIEEGDLGMSGNKDRSKNDTPLSKTINLPNITATMSETQTPPNPPDTPSKDSTSDTSSNSDSLSTRNSADSQGSRSPPDMSNKPRESDAGNSLSSIDRASTSIKKRFIDFASENEIRAVFIKPKCGFKVMHSSLGRCCLFDTMKEFQTAVCNFNINKDVFRWTGQVKYNQNHINSAPLLGLGIVTKESRSLSDSGSCYFVFGMTDGVQGSGLLGVEDASKIVWNETIIPENSVISIVADGEKKTLCFFLGENKIPLIVSGITVPYRLGITGRGQPSFTSISLRRLGAAPVCDIQCREFKCVAG